MASWNIPGMGERKPYCGDDKFKRLQCSTGKAGHDIKVIKRGCRKSACPTCWPDYVNREAGKATDKLFEVKRLYRLAGYELLHPVHMVISPPKTEYETPEPELREQARQIAKKTGVIGGCMVFHPYRFKGRDTVEHRAFKFPLKRSQENFRQGFGKDPEYQPHYHLIGFMPDYDPTNPEKPFKGLKSNDLEQTTGWIYKNIGRTTKKGLLMNVYGKIQYELTHVGIKPEGRQGQTLTWFGIVSNNSVSCVVEKVEEQATCSICGADMDLIQDEVNMGPHTFKHITRTYHLKPEARERNVKKFARWLGHKRLNIKPDPLEARYQEHKHRHTHNKERARRAILQDNYDDLIDDDDEPPSI